MSESEPQPGGHGAEDQDDTSPPVIAKELVDHVRNPRNLGLLPNADVVVEAIGECGDSMEVSLIVRNSRIQKVGFVPRGCAFTLACGSLASTLAEGRTLAEARREVHPMAIDAGLGGLPEDHGHCASLAAGAIWKAINAYLTAANEPWKRFYR